MFRAAGLLSFRSTTLTRTYVAVGGRSYPRPSVATKTAPATQASTVQTEASKGIPDTDATAANEDSSTQKEIGNNIPADALTSPPPLLDAPPPGGTTDWSRSYHGLSTQSFPPEVTDVLQADINPLDIEMKPGTSL
jgi:hypothetical protein